MIKTALFDMDGTMYDTERLSLEGWLKAASEMGIPLTADMIKEFRGSNLRTNAERFKGWFGPEAPYYETRKLRTDYVTTYIREHVPGRRGDTGPGASLETADGSGREKSGQLPECFSGRAEDLRPDHRSWTRRSLTRPRI